MNQRCGLQDLQSSLNRQQMNGATQSELILKHLHGQYTIALSSTQTRMTPTFAMLIPLCNAYARQRLCTSGLVWTAPFDNTLGGKSIGGGTILGGTSKKTGNADLGYAYSRRWKISGPALCSEQRSCLARDCLIAREICGVCTVPFPFSSFYSAALCVQSIISRSYESGA